ncbi:GNAT family N-acetyltransferase [Clostridium sp.]|uniref:GNAT family N-acetyltransferase n=1 Tax=Clostridium sp. TaxID=1506 RepID=UPI003F36C150
MSNTVKILEIKEDNIEEVLKVIHNSFETVAKEYGLTKDNSKGNAAFINKGKLISDKKSGNLMYGLFKDEELIGFMQLKKKNDLIYILENLSILPMWRNNGYGILLLDKAKEDMKNLGGKKLSLGCMYENTKLVDWYVKNGFIYKGKKSYKKYPYTVGFFEYM